MGSAMAAAARSRGRSHRRRHYKCSLILTSMTGTGTQISEFTWRRERLPEETAWSRCFVDKGLAVSNRIHVAAGYTSCCRPGATALALANREPSCNEKYIFWYGARKSCRAKKRPMPRGRGRGCNKASWRRSSPVPSGVWAQEAAMRSRHQDPQRPTILGFQLPHPTLGTDILHQG